MKCLQSVVMVATLFACASAAAEIKPCEELKGEIEAKLKEKGVTNYSLEVVPADQVKDQKVVGSCDGGKSKITYTKEDSKKEGKEKK
jgi:uncharacterized protein DUF1161